MRNLESGKRQYNVKSSGLIRAVLYGLLNHVLNL